MAVVKSKSYCSFYVTVGPQKRGFRIRPEALSFPSERSVNTFEPPCVLNVREHEAYVRRNYHLLHPVLQS